MVKFVRIEDVVKLFKELTPWDQAEVQLTIGRDFNCMSDEEILQEFDIDPIDHVDAHDAVREFGRELLDDFDTFDLLSEIDDRLWNIKPKSIVDLVCSKFYDGKDEFTEKDVERLEKLVAELKKKRGEQEDELLGITAVIRDDDGTFEDGNYSSWLDLKNKEYTLSKGTKFKEGDKVEIYARKAK